MLARLPGAGPELARPANCRQNAVAIAANSFHSRHIGGCQGQSQRPWARLRAESSAPESATKFHKPYRRSCDGSGDHQHGRSPTRGSSVTILRQFAGGWDEASRMTMTVF